MKNNHQPTLLVARRAGSSTYTVPASELEPGDTILLSSQPHTVQSRAARQQQHAPLTPGVESAGSDIVLTLRVKHPPAAATSDAAKARAPRTTFTILVEGDALVAVPIVVVELHVIPWREDYNFGAWGGAVLARAGGRVSLEAGVFGKVKALMRDGEVGEIVVELRDVQGQRTFADAYTLPNADGEGWVGRGPARKESTVFEVYERGRIGGELDPEVVGWGDIDGYFLRRAKVICGRVVEG